MNKIDKYLSEETVNEGKEFPVNVLAQIEKLTDRNDHDAARVLVAKTMNNKKMLAAYEGIQAINNFLGHMPQEISKVRYNIDKVMFNMVKSKYSNGQEVYMAF